MRTLNESVMERYSDKTRNQEDPFSWAKLQEIFLHSLNTEDRSRAPPVNNLCMPDVYNKLDAGVQERTKVSNALLDMRLQVQARTLERYRRQAEQMYQREKLKLRNEYTGIHRRLPNVQSFDPTNRQLSKYKNVKKKRKRELIGYTTVPREIKGVPAEKNDRPFCHRFRTHHLVTKRKGLEIPITHSHEFDSSLGPQNRLSFNKAFPSSRPLDTSHNNATNTVPSANSDSRLALHHVNEDDDDDTMTI